MSASAYILTTSSVPDGRTNARDNLYFFTSASIFSCSPGGVTTHLSASVVTITRLSATCSIRNSPFICVLELYDESRMEKVTGKMELQVLMRCAAWRRAQFGSSLLNSNTLGCLGSLLSYCSAHISPVLLGLEEGPVPWPLVSLWTGAAASASRWESLNSFLWLI